MDSLKELVFEVVDLDHVLREQSVSQPLLVYAQTGAAARGMEILNCSESVPEKNAFITVTPDLFAAWTLSEMADEAMQYLETSKNLEEEEQYTHLGSLDSLKYSLRTTFPTLSQPRGRA